MATEQWESARASFQRALRLQSDYDEAAYELSRTCALLGNEAEALEAYEMASPLKPQADDYLYRVGMSLLRLGRLDDAQEIHRRLSAINPVTADKLLMKIEAIEP